MARCVDRFLATGEAPNPVERTLLAPAHLAFCFESNGRESSSKRRNSDQLPRAGHNWFQTSVILHFFLHNGGGLNMTRREWLGVVLPRPHSGEGCSGQPCAADARRTKSAAIVTVYRYNSHADVLVGRLLAGYSSNAVMDSV